MKKFATLVFVFSVAGILVAESDYTPVKKEDTQATATITALTAGTITTTGNVAAGANLTVTGTTTLSGSNVLLSSIPTSSSGLASGALYNSSGTVKIKD